jgi:hypothetical protein
VDTYPCPACGGVADETDGCRSCGRPHDPLAATLAKLNRDLAGLEDQSQRLASSQSTLKARRARLYAHRINLSNAIAQRLADEAASTKTKTGAPKVPRQPGRGSERALSAAGASEPSNRETTSRSLVNTLLALGGVLVGLAAIGVYYTSVETGGRAFMLALVTTVALGMPVALARRTLTATAETIAAVGLLLVLLDGYVAYTLDLAGVGGVPGPLYAAVLFALVALVAAAYRLATHLRAPQFTALLAVQPLLPLIAVQLELGRIGFAAVFAGVAAQNVAAVRLLSRSPNGRDTRTVPAPGTAKRMSPRPVRASAWPRMLRELAWVLVGLALATGVVLAGTDLLRATTVEEAIRASLALLAAAAVGMIAGQVSGRLLIRRLATGGATLAVIASLSRVNAIALPDYTLVLTAALAAGIAIVAGLLPTDVRVGPQLGSLVAAALTTVVVVVGAVRTAVAAVQAATAPRTWAADLGAYASRMEVTSWQVPAAAVLLAIVASAATPSPWRWDAAVVGGFVAVLAAPATGDLAWWAPAVMGAVASPLATVAALFARTWSGALVRSSVAGLLGIYAVLTSLARPELTAGICSALAVVAAATAVSGPGWPGRFGPYADRVGDAATGAAAFTLPIAVGSYAFLLGAPTGVLLPLTMLATALGALAAALSQVAAPLPRTASAGGALAASVGCVLLSVQLPGAMAADVMLGLLLLLAAAVTAASRAFEATPGGLFEAAQDVPAAVGAFTAAVAGDQEVREPIRRRRRISRLDGVTFGGAAATGALIFAMARLMSVAVPGIGLVTTMAMVFPISIGVRALPEAWRRGPRIGAGTVAGAIGLVTAAIAVTQGVRTLAAATPWWRADLVAFPSRISEWAPYGWQVPVTLLLTAAAAVFLLPPPYGGDLGFVAMALAAVAFPAAAGLDWWTPIVFTGILSVIAGLGAVLLGHADPADAAHRRLGMAAILGLYAAAAAAARPDSTAVVLSAIMACGFLVAVAAQLRGSPHPAVPGVATAAALSAAPGTAATIAVIAGSTRVGVLGSAMTAAAFGVFVLVALRAARVRWTVQPAFGVAAVALVVALADLSHLETLQVWAALASLIAVAAAATLKPWTLGDPRPRASALVIATTAAPAAALAVVGSAPAWFAAVFGPYETLQQIWSGYAAVPQPPNADTAVLTLALLTAVAAGMALTLGGRRYVLAAIVPPLAALAMVAPTALAAPRPVTSWVAMAVALATGFGAALVRPTVPAATRLLRGTAGIVCGFAGAAGLAGALATRSSTLTALGIVLAAGVLTATAGRDPAVRMVAWMVAAAAGMALPVTAFAAADRPLRPSAYAVLAVCAALVTLGLVLARLPARRAEAPVVELGASIGGAFALLLTLSSARHTAAVLTIWGLLLGLAAIRRDRPAPRRRWLIRGALAAELVAAWLLLYSVDVGLPEAYTLPFALVALVAGALELRRRPDLSSWQAYGTALAGSFLPSLVLVLVGNDPVWRWVGLLGVSVASVIIGSLRGRLAPVVTGSAVAILVALTEMVRLLAAGEIAGAVLVAVFGVVLIVVGAMYEKRLRGALRQMS